MTDEVLEQLPRDTEDLRLRGPYGYGMDDVTDAGIAHLADCSRLKVLEIGAFRLTDRSLETIGQLSELEELAIDSNLITGEGLHHLLNLKKLRRLNLSFNPLSRGWEDTVSRLTTLTRLDAIVYEQPLDDDTLSRLSQLKELEWLTVNENAAGVTDVGLASLTTLTKLRAINLSNAKITSRGVARLANLSGLESLQLRDLRQLEPGSLVWLDRLPRLKRLEIVGIWMNEADLDAINTLAALESLLIWNVSRGQDAVRIEQLDGLKNLKAFRSNESITSSAFRDLSQISTLESIGDELTQVTDADLVELAKLPKLRALQLDSLAITDRSLSTLAGMQAMRYLVVSDRTGLTAEQLTELSRHSVPNCEIHYRTAGGYRRIAPAP